MIVTERRTALLCGSALGAMPAIRVNEAALRRAVRDAEHRLKPKAPFNDIFRFSNGMTAINWATPIPAWRMR